MMKAKARSSIVEFQDKSNTNSSLSTHEKHDIGYEVSAIPDDTCQEPWRWPSTPKVQQMPILPILILLAFTHISRCFRDDFTTVEEHIP